MKKSQNKLQVAFKLFFALLVIASTNSTKLEASTDKTELIISINSVTGTTHQDADDQSFLELELFNDGLIPIYVQEITLTQFGSINRNNLDDLKLVDTEKGHIVCGPEELSSGNELHFTDSFEIPARETLTLVLRGDIEYSAQEGNTIAFKIADPASDVITDADVITPLSSINGSIITVDHPSAIIDLDKTNPSAQNIPSNIEFPFLIFSINAEENIEIDGAKIELSGLFNSSDISSVKLVDVENNVLDSPRLSFDNSIDFEFDYEIEKGDTKIFALVMYIAKDSDGDISAKLTELEAKSGRTGNEINKDSLPIGGEKITFVGDVFHDGTEDSDEKYGYKQVFSFSDWISLGKKSICTDSDGGRKYNTRGTTEGKTSWKSNQIMEHEDSCINFDIGPTGQAVNSCTKEDDCKVYELFCQGDYVEYEYKKCSYGCYKGVCLEEEATSCTDSDGGKNYYEFGEVLVNPDTNLESEHADYCSLGYKNKVTECSATQDECLLYEMHCDSNDDSAVAKAFQCPNGCKNGACLQKEMEGYDLSVEDIRIKEESEFNDKGERKIWIFSDMKTKGSKDSDKFKGILYIDGEKKETFDSHPEGLAPNQEVVHLFGRDFFLSPGKHTFKVKIILDADNQDKDNNVLEKEIYVSEKEPVAVCKETDDGVDYYEKGATYDKGATKPFVDTCEGNTLKEHWCGTDGRLKSDNYECAYGCKNGACLKGEGFNDKCNDTDGKNYYQKGEVYYFEAQDSPTEVCVNDSVVEHWCDENEKLITESFECPNGCLNGACICESGDCLKYKEADNKKTISPKNKTGDTSDGSKTESSQGDNQEKCPDLKDYKDSCAVWYMGRVEKCSGEDCYVYKNTCQFNGSVGQYMVMTESEKCPGSCKDGVCDSDSAGTSTHQGPKTTPPSASYSDPVLTDYNPYLNPFPDTGQLGNLHDTNFDNIEAVAAAELSRRNISKGHQDGRFLGLNSVNRAEAATFLIRSRYQDKDIEEVSAEDVKKIQEATGELLDILSENGELVWYTKYIVKAWKLGIIKGYKDKDGKPTGKFGPKDPVKGGEFLVMIQKTFDLKTDLIHSYDLSSFPEKAFYLPYLGLANKYSLFPRMTKDGNIDPGKKLSRYEVSVAIYQYFRLRD